MSDFPEDLPYLMPIPTAEDGELNFAPVAMSILMDLEKAPAGRKLVIKGRIGMEEGWFQARYDPGAILTVRKICLGSKFGAALFMALQDLAPKRVLVEDVVNPLPPSIPSCEPSMPNDQVQT